MSNEMTIKQENSKFNNYNKAQLAQYRSDIAKFDDLNHLGCLAAEYRDAVEVYEMWGVDADESFALVVEQMALDGETQPIKQHVSDLINCLTQISDLHWFNDDIDDAMADEFIAAVLNRFFDLPVTCDAVRLARFKENMPDANKQHSLTAQVRSWTQRAFKQACGHDLGEMDVAQYQSILLNDINMICTVLGSSGLSVITMTDLHTLDGQLSHPIPWGDSPIVDLVPSHWATKFGTFKQYMRLNNPECFLWKPFTTRILASYTMKVRRMVAYCLPALLTGVVDNDTLYHLARCLAVYTTPTDRLAQDYRALANLFGDKTFKAVED